jgi:hypothetical protein
MIASTWVTPGNRQNSAYNLLRKAKQVSALRRIFVLPKIAIIANLYYQAFA